MRSPSLSAIALLLSSTVGFSATFSAFNSLNSPFVVPFLTLNDELGVPLDNGPDGATGTPGDGDLLMIGQTSDSRTTNLLGDPATWPEPAWSSFFPLTGVGSNNHAADPSLNTTMGDGDTIGFDGLYSLGVTLNSDDHPNLPQSGTWVVVRFYNDKTIESSTHYTTVAARSLTWLANTTADQPGAAASLSLDANRAALVWEGGVPFQTNLPNPDFVPEPSAALLSLISMVFFLRRRR